MSYSSTYQFARKWLEHRLKKKEYDFEGTLKEVIEKMDRWFMAYFNYDPSFRLEYDAKTNTIIICHDRYYGIFRVKTVFEGEKDV